MRRPTSFLLLLVLTVKARGFDQEGFRSGMSMAEAKAGIASRSYSKVQVKDTVILLWGPDFCSLSCYKDRLRIYQRNLAPEFPRFVQSVKALRDRLGRPYDAIGDTADPLESHSVDSIRMFWSEGEDIVEVSYRPGQLSIIYS